MSNTLSSKISGLYTSPCILMSRGTIQLSEINCDPIFPFQPVEARNRETSWIRKSQGRTGAGPKYSEVCCSLLKLSLWRDDQVALMDLWTYSCRTICVGLRACMQDAWTKWQVMTGHCLWEIPSISLRTSGSVIGEVVEFMLLDMSQVLGPTNLFHTFSHQYIGSQHRGQQLVVLLRKPPSVEISETLHQQLISSQFPLAASVTALFCNVGIYCCVSRYLHIFPVYLHIFPLPIAGRKAYLLKKHVSLRESHWESVV